MYLFHSREERTSKFNLKKKEEEKKKSGTKLASTIQGMFDSHVSALQPVGEHCDEVHSQVRKLFVGAWAKEILNSVPEKAYIQKEEKKYTTNLKAAKI